MRNQRPFGKRKGKPRGRQITKEWKASLMCKICEKKLPNAPDQTLTKDIVDRFLADYGEICPCKPPHCDVCTCYQCDPDSQDNPQQTDTPQLTESIKVKHGNYNIIYFHLKRRSVIRL